MHRQIAGKLTGPVTKWVVLVAVLVLTGVMAALGSKLADVKNNEQSSWVPSSAESTRVADQISGGNDDDLLFGSCFGDSSDSSGVSNALSGGPGNDLLQGGDGPDEMTGGSGADLMYGGAGNDQLVGNSGADQLSGDDDTDICDGTLDFSDDVANASCETTLNIP